MGMPRNEVVRLRGRPVRPVSGRRVQNSPGAWTTRIKGPAAIIRRGMLPRLWKSAFLGAGERFRPKHAFAPAENFRGKAWRPLRLSGIPDLRPARRPPEGRSGRSVRVCEKRRGVSRLGKGRAALSENAGRSARGRSRVCGRSGARVRRRRGGGSARRGDDAAARSGGRNGQDRPLPHGRTSCRRLAEVARTGEANRRRSRCF